MSSQAVADRLPATTPRSLAPAQEGQWEVMCTLSPGDPGAARYVVVDNRAILGPLDVGVMRDACDDVLARHDGLRLRFEVVDVDPVVTVDDDTRSPFEVLDLTSASQEARADAIDELVWRENRRTFDLRAGPLWHLWLVRITPERHLLTLSLSHVISDGFSVNVFVRDLLVAYLARVGGGRPFDDDAPSFAELHELQGRRLAPTPERLRYWREHVGRALSTRPADPDDDGRLSLPRYRVVFEFAPETHQRLAAVAWRRRTTPFVVLMSAYWLLGNVLTGRRHLVVGTATHARAGRERGAVFQCVSDPYVAIDVPGTASVADAVKLTSRALDEAVDNLVSYKSIARAVNDRFDLERPWPDARFTDGCFISSAPDVYDTSSGSRVPHSATGAAVALAPERLVAPRPPSSKKTNGVEDLNALVAPLGLTVQQVHLRGRPPADHREEPAPPPARRPDDRRLTAAPEIEVFTSRMGGGVRYADAADGDVVRRCADQYVWLVEAMLDRQDDPVDDLLADHRAWLKGR